MKKTLLTILVVSILVVSCVLGVACTKTKYTIGTQSGTTGQYYIEGNSDYPGFSNVKCSAYTNAGLAVTDMKNGNINAVCVDSAPADFLVKSIEGIKVIDIPLTDEKYAFAVNKSKTDLLTKINEILSSTEFATAKEGIMNKYFNGAEVEGVTALTTADGSKEATQLVVATNAEFAPFEYKIGDKFAGIDMEIAAYVANKLGMELVVLDMEFDSVVTSVASTKDEDALIDVGMAGLTVTEERKQSVNFTNSYYTASQKLVVLASDTSYDNCKTAADVEAVIKSK